MILCIQNMSNLVIKYKGGWFLMCKLAKKCIIAIDGGSGVGKTTVSKALSKKLGIIYMIQGQCIGLQDYIF